MNIYSRRVSDGTWRDYAINFGKDEAAFSIFRHTAENPDFQILKRPEDRLRRGQYRVVDRGGRILKRSDALATVLAVLARRVEKTR